MKVTGANGSATRHFTLTVMTQPGNPPVINSVGPFSGLSGEQLNFTADVTGDGPLTYSWEFDGGASPPVSAESNPTAILSRGGTLPSPNKEYPCRLTVSNDSGSASADFTLTVSAQWHLLETDFTDLSLCVYRNDGQLALISKIGSELQYLELHDGSWIGQVVPFWGFTVLGFHPISGEPVAVCDTGPFGNRLVNYAWRSGGIWNKEEVGGGGMIGNDVLLAYHQDGTPVIAWTEIGDKSKVAIAEKNYGNWQVEYLPVGELSVGATDLTVNSENRTVLAFSDFSGTLWEAWIAIRQVSGWQMEKVPEYGGYSYVTSMSDGSLQLSLVRQPPYPAPRVLSFAAFAGNIWTIEDADTGASPSIPGKPLLLADGTPLILCSSYGYDDNAPEFRASWKTPSGWVSERQFPPLGDLNTWEARLVGFGTDGTIVSRVFERVGYGDDALRRRFFGFFW